MGDHRRSLTPGIGTTRPQPVGRGRVLRVDRAKGTQTRIGGERSWAVKLNVG